MAAPEKVHKIDEDRLSLISRMSQAVVDIPKTDLQEVKSYAKPPKSVQEVLEATLVLLGDKNTSWAASKQAIADLSFRKRIQDLDPESVPDERRERARKILDDTTKETVFNVSRALVTIYEWCEAVAED